VSNDITVLRPRLRKPPPSLPVAPFLPGLHIHVPRADYPPCIPTIQYFVVINARIRHRALALLVPILAVSLSGTAVTLALILRDSDVPFIPGEERSACKSLPTIVGAPELSMLRNSGSGSLFYSRFSREERKLHAADVIV
jgi:hypothetical protein